MVHFPGLLQLRLFNDLCLAFCHNCVEFKLCVLMVCLVMCFYINKAIAWLGCRLFVDMVSQLSPKYNVSYCLIGDDFWISIYVCIIC